MATVERTQVETDARITGSRALNRGEAPGVGADASSLTVKSFELIRACGLAPDDPIVAVGDVDAHLIAALLDVGHRDLTVLHPSMEALEALRQALGDLEGEVILTEADPLQFQPHRRYALWQDRGFFHRLTHPDDRQRYVEVVQYALRPEGHLVISASGPEGPTEDRGLPLERYSAPRLAAELGRQFELSEEGLELHPLPHGGYHQLLHCHFRRHAPHWPAPPR